MPGAGRLAEGCLESSVQSGGLLPGRGPGLGGVVRDERVDDLRLVHRRAEGVARGERADLLGELLQVLRGLETA